MDGKKTRLNGQMSKTQISQLKVKIKMLPLQIFAYRMKNCALKSVVTSVFLIFGPKYVTHFFSHVHVTLYEGLSVSPSVGPSVHPSVRRSVTRFLNAELKSTRP